jgi:hypothetical protein
MKNNTWIYDDLTMDQFKKFWMKAQESSEDASAEQVADKQPCQW